MAKLSQSAIFIPASLVPQFEAWGKLTVKLFGELRRHAGLKAQKIPDDQAWYWTEQWQRWEKQADEDIAVGRIKNFNSVDGLIADLGV